MAESCRVELYNIIYVQYDATTVQVLVRIDFTPRGPGLGRKVGFLQRNRMDFVPRCSGSGHKVNFYRPGHSNWVPTVQRVSADRPVTGWPVGLRPGFRSVVN